jgi:hypothetical protein
MTVESPKILVELPIIAKLYEVSQEHPNHIVILRIDYQVVSISIPASRLLCFWVLVFFLFFFARRATKVTYFLLVFGNECAASGKQRCGSGDGACAGGVFALELANR